MGATLDISGPVRAEVLLVAVGETGVVRTGPCGAAPWYIETHGDAHPMQVVAEVVAGALGPVDVLHSTSWRWDRGSVVLTFIAIIPADAIGTMATESVARADIVRGGPVDAPPEIDDHHVLEHALRHLSWLVEDDAEVAAALGTRRKDMLAGYTPEPFRQLGGGHGG